jgi:chromosomal replication initiation ATPase DnaA
MNHLVDDELKINIQNKLKNTFEKTIDNPVLKAQLSWDILSDQLNAILGNEVHNQWFKNIQPIVLKNNILLLQTETNFASQWINTHYQQLVDALIMIQDKKYTCFFISPKQKSKRLVSKSSVQKKSASKSA